MHASHRPCTASTDFSNIARSVAVEIDLDDALHAAAPITTGTPT